MFTFHCASSSLVSLHRLSRIPLVHSLFNDPSLPTFHFLPSTRFYLVVLAPLFQIADAWRMAQLYSQISTHHFLLSQICQHLSSSIVIPDKSCQLFCSATKPQTAFPAGISSRKLVFVVDRQPAACDQHHSSSNSSSAVQPLVQRWLH